MSFLSCDDLGLDLDLPLLPQVLKGCRTLAMTVYSLGHIPGGHITNHLYSWVDPQGRSVSPPPDPGEANHVHGACTEERTVGAPSHLLRLTHLSGLRCVYGSQLLG